MRRSKGITRREEFRYAAELWTVPAALAPPALYPGATGRGQGGWGGGGGAAKNIHLRNKFSSTVEVKELGSVKSKLSLFSPPTFTAAELPARRARVAAPQVLRSAAGPRAPSGSTLSPPDFDLQSREPRPLRRYSKVSAGCISDFDLLNVYMRYLLSTSSWNQL